MTLAEAEDDSGVNIFVEEAEDDGIGRQVEAVKGGRYMRVRRTRTAGAEGGGGGGSRPKGPRVSIFEELGEPIPDNVVLPDEEAVTIFDVPLYVYSSRPWEVSSADVDVSD